MAFLYFVGASQQWLEDRLKEINDELVTDRPVVAWTEGGSSATKLKGNASAMARRNMILHDLNILDPDNYPLDLVIPKTSVGVFVDNS